MSRQYSFMATWRRTSTWPNQKASKKQAMSIAYASSKKSLYELKQSPRQWYKRFDSFMIQKGFTRCEYECYVYLKKVEHGSYLYLLLYVDDMLIAVEKKSDVNKVKHLLSKEFDMKDLGAAKKILDMVIKRGRSKNQLWVNQIKYMENALEIFSMTNAKSVSTPLAGHFRLTIQSSPTTDEERRHMT